MNRIIFVGILLILSPQALAEIPSPLSTPSQEIEVSADAWAWTPPDHVRVTVLVEASGKTSVEALKVLQGKAGTITAAIKQVIGEEGNINSRGDEITPTGQSKLDTTAEVQMKRYIGIETKALEKSSAIIDAALKAGARSITDVDYAVRDDHQNRLHAIEEATQRAKNKAEALAKSLGITLGSVLSATVTEESDGRTLRDKRIRGEDVAANYRDTDSHIFVSLRFGILKN